MEEAEKRDVKFTSPSTFTGLTLKDPVNRAAGILGVKEALKHTFKEMGALRAMEGLLKMNQQDGFDCPSCAWPDPKNPSPVAEYCENGAKALGDEATTTTIGADFFAKYSVEELSRMSDFQLNKFGRLAEPLILRPGSVHYEPLSYELAFKAIAKGLKDLDHPDEAIFYTSGRSSNEAAFLYGIFARAFGTNNMPDCSNMCHESSGVALSQTVGIGKGTVTLEDFYEAEVVICAGQNPGTNHPRMLSALEKCKENGGKVISINPLEETGLVSFKNPQNVKGYVGSGEKMADIHLPVKINQDVPLIKLILKKLALLDSVNHSIFDHDFINKYVSGYDALIADLKKYDERDLLDACGVPEDRINATVALLSKKSKIIVCWAMGLTQHKNAVANIKELINLLLLKGAMGKPNAGSCPVRGHSNVQGDRSVGIMHYVDEAFNERVKTHFKFDPPTEEGVDVVQAMQAMHDGKAKFFMCLGGNFLMAASDTKYTAEAIENCTMTVQVSTKLNRTHLVTGRTAIILPTLGRSEKETISGQQQYHTIENSMGQIRKSQGILKPVKEDLLGEPHIIAGIAKAYFSKDFPVNWENLGNDYELIRSYIDKVAKGFENTSERAGGNGYYLPNNARELDFSMLPDGKAQLTVTKLPEHKLKADEFLLMTIRSHDQFNTTIYGLDDRYRGVYGERRVLFMNPEDAAQHQLHAKSVVDLSSFYDGVTRKAERFLIVPYNIPRGNLAAYFPETNTLVPYNHYAAGSRTPISKSIVVKVHRVLDPIPAK